LHRPHWPWRIPSSFLDKVAPIDDIALPVHKLPPTGVPPVAMNFFTELLDPNWRCFNCTVTDADSRQYRRHYYAAVRAELCARACLA
jgi:hypothetical protein